MSQPAQANVRSEQPLLEVRHLHVRFGRQEVLRDVGFKLYAGQALAIIGESGCGKTVLLKSLVGRIRPYRGEVLFHAQDLLRLNEKELTAQRLRFGFVFQNAALFDSLTVAQNIAFPLRYQGRFSEEHIQQVVRRRLHEVGLPESVLEKKPAQLSGGMRKRVGLARALAMEPEVLLYDEPTTGLDPIMSDVINELILRTQASGQITSVIVTHDMRTVRKTADRVLMLYPLSRLKHNQPQVIFQGTPEELEQAPDPRVRQFVRGQAGERLRELDLPVG